LFAKAKEFFDQVKTGEARAVILESVVAECVYILTRRYRVPRDEAAASLIDILRYRGVVSKDRQELIQALTLFAEHNLDIVDCILHAKATSAGDRLFTFDSNLDGLDKKSHATQ